MQDLQFDEFSLLEKLMFEHVSVGVVESVEIGEICV